MRSPFNRLIEPSPGPVFREVRTCETSMLGARLTMPFWWLEEGCLHTLGGDQGSADRRKRHTFGFGR